jgi:hypothetical protein
MPKTPNKRTQRTARKADREAPKSLWQFFRESPLVDWNLNSSARRIPAAILTCPIPTSPYTTISLTFHDCTKSSAILRTERGTISCLQNNRFQTTLTQAAASEEVIL